VNQEIDCSLGVAKPIKSASEINAWQGVIRSQLAHHRMSCPDFAFAFPADKCFPVGMIKPGVTAKRVSEIEEIQDLLRTLADE
jgi:hypothetical protein